ncbi:MAG: alkane 1-monooxygenase [Sphingomonas sp.]|nr:alkane 1-monooxygenase [Sphingomonas sp.]
MPIKYLTPFAFLALLPLGGWLGGTWTFAAAAATVVCMPGLDVGLGEHGPRAQAAHALFRWLPRMYILAQLGVTAWMAWIVSRPETNLVETVGLTISTGITTGVFGFVAAHEMIHSRDERLRSLGLAMFATAFYMHFGIAHLAGHHRQAATDNDPTSARLGESLYGFILRSVTGQFREAWAFDIGRMRRADRWVFGTGNRMSIYLAIEVALIVVLSLLSRGVLAFLLAAAVIAVTLLETFNYVAHYGLRRRIGANGKPEPLRPTHSWNSRRRMDKAALFNMGCHSDHHSHPSRSFDRLEPVPGGAILPFGYGTALLTALIPPIWKRIMDQRALAVV